MKAQASKTDRWFDGVEAARSALDELSGAVQELLAVQPEIETSYENMTEGLQQTERGLLYESIIGIDLSQVDKLTGDLESIINDAEMAG